VGAGVEVWFETVFEFDVESATFSIPILSFLKIMILGSSRIQRIYLGDCME
jgi:hypothetical protein